MIEVVLTRSHRIVVGIDGSAASDRALEWAVEEAEVRRADLEVVHVRFAREELLDSYPHLAAAEAELLSTAVDRARGLARRVHVSGSLVSPPAGEALVQASRGADLLVVGTRGMSFWRRVEQGSVSTHCIHHACCPVVLVRRTGAPEPESALERIGTAAPSLAPGLDQPSQIYSCQVVQLC